MTAVHPVTHIQINKSKENSYEQNCKRRIPSQHALAGQT